MDLDEESSLAQGIPMWSYLAVPARALQAGIRAGLGASNRAWSAFRRGVSSSNAPAWVQAGGTVVLVVITSWYADLTNRLVRAQVEPTVEFEVDHLSKELALANEGPYPVVNVSVNADTLLMLGPPHNQPATRLTHGPAIPGRPRSDWWHLMALGPGDVQRRSIDEVLGNALRDLRQMENLKARGNLGGIRPDESVQFFAFVTFHLTYHRELDRKRYQAKKIVHVVPDSQSGKPIAFDLDTVAFPLLQEMFLHVRDGR